MSSDDLNEKMSAEELNAMDEDAQRMDMDLCSMLLDCWDEATKPEKEEQTGSMGSMTPTVSERNRMWEVGSDGNPMGMSDLPNFLLDNGDFAAASLSEPEHAQNAAQGDSRLAFSTCQQSESTKSIAFYLTSSTTHAPQQLSCFDDNAGNGDRELGESRTTYSENTSIIKEQRNSSESRMSEEGKLQTTNNSNAPGMAMASTQLHPQAIQSSAECPPHVGTLKAVKHMDPTNSNSRAFTSMTGCTSSRADNSIYGAQAAASTFEAPEHKHSKNESTEQTQTRDTNNAKPPPDNLPPFLLFDAPLELRSNFIASQKAHGLPVLQDNNSFHYGMAVNGFHPHQLKNLRLADARHGDAGNKRAKNAKEQKRAQQITNLIDLLRLKMEKDGWKVELKSKFHTLSSCADYVRHLVKRNKEKEEAIEKAKLDLEAKKRQLEDDKAQQDPSDPESTTSDLTESSGSAGAGGSGAVKSGNSHDKSQKGTFAAVGDSDNTGRDDNKRKKARLMVSLESTLSSTTSSGGDDRGQARPGVQTVSADQTTSSVSDVTDSNKGSSMKSSSEDGKEMSNNASNSVSSDAAVASGPSSDNAHSDIIINGDRRSSHTARDVNSFDLDYEEVFVKSNVPQLLASTSGRIVTWNDFFLRVTGLKTKEVKKLTIFSLVSANDLAKLFEIVAYALRTGSFGEDYSNGESSEYQQRNWNYAAITLPCISFPRHVSEGMKRRRLYMTVTLMADDDPRKRCFHCLFTDNPGTNGSLGSITPELLSALFTSPCPGESTEKNGKSRKKRKTPT